MLLSGREKEREEDAHSNVSQIDLTEQKWEQIRDLLERTRVDLPLHGQGLGA